MQVSIPVYKNTKRKLSDHLVVLKNFCTPHVFNVK